MEQTQNIHNSVIIDTGGAVDNTLTLIMASNLPQLVIRVITVIAGNIHN